MSTVAVALMRELGIDISGQQPKRLTDALGPDVALIIGLCAEEACPAVPGVPSFHWPLPDPRDRDPEQFRQIRDDLRERITRLAADLRSGKI